MTEAEIFELACNAAQAASDKAANEATSWYPCGFASIHISPARGKFVSYLKRCNIGGAAYGGGYRISSYDVCTQEPKWCQSMDVKFAGASAFAKVLRDHGINASARSQMD